MSDCEAEKQAAETPETPEAPNKRRVAKVGVKDSGEVVTTYGGEPIEGIIADLSDGD